MVEGLEIRENEADRGGGVYSREDGTLVDCLLQANVASSYGGGLMCREGSMSLSDTSFEANEAPGGAGMLLDDCSMDLAAVTISGGSATYGGGLYLVSSEVDADSAVLITDNEAASLGGGVYVSSNAAWDGGAITANFAEHGAGMYLVDETVVDEVLVNDNLASEWGGGIFAAAQADLDAVTLDNNQASYGAGLYVYVADEVRLSSSTVTANSASVRGGGVRVGAGVLDVTDTDFGSEATDNDPDDVYAGGTAYSDYGTGESFSCTGTDGCS